MLMSREYIKKSHAIIAKSQLSPDVQRVSFELNINELLENSFFPEDNPTVPSVCLSDNSLLVLDKYQDTGCYEFSFYSRNYTASSTQTTLCFVFYEREHLSYLDDVSVISVGSNNRNQLRNGGFENTWRRNAWQTENGFITISTFGRLGNGYSHHHDVYPGYHRYLWQTFSTVPGHMYNISFYFISRSPSVPRIPSKVLVGN